MAKIKYKDRMKVLIVSSEVSPLAKAGGLGDTVGALPKVLARDYHLEIKIIMPKYKNFDFKTYPAELIINNLNIILPDNHHSKKINVWKTFLPGTIIPIYLIDAPEIFNGNEIYNHKNSDLNQYAFYFLTKVALELIKIFDWWPDIVHTHDGMTGLTQKWLKTIYLKDKYYQKIATVFTIHNLNHQPRVEASKLKYIGLKRRDVDKIRKYLRKNYVNIMAEAIDNADMINTVSPTYAKEILTKKYGVGLNRLLKENKKKFTGILNGMDYSVFDPRTNDDTPVKYWIDTLDKKVEDKLFLQKKLGLTQTPDLPLICVVSRIAEQKGLDLINDVLNELVDMGAQFVILGSGNENIEKIFIKAEKEHPKEIAAEMQFDAHFAQTIYAGADMLLMPSRFEPCGLSQIIAMRFGTIPIVRKTGGLADTVRDGFTGFVFKDYDKNAFLWAIRRAVDIYYNQKDYWRKMQTHAMRKDFSWKASAKKYIWLYKKAIRNHQEYLKKLKEIQGISVNDKKEAK